MSWTDIKSSGSRGGHGSNMNGLVSVSLNGDGSGSRNICRLGIPVEAMRAMRFTRGDQVKVRYQLTQKMILVTRVTERKTGTLGPTSVHGKSQVGQIATSTLQIKADEGLKAILPTDLARCAWSPESEGLIIQLP